MARPVVLVATTNPAMAYALQENLKDKCKELGLKLEVCPDGDESDLGRDVRTYDSAEALFDALEKREPMELADTLVVLDVGAELEKAFEPKAQSDDGWHVTSNRAGVAAELLLRFPQVFPVFLSPAVPVKDRAKEKEERLIHPESGETVSGNKLEQGNWGGFSLLQENLATKHEGSNTADNKISLDTLFALATPLHFVSPLDQDSGLCSVLQRFARGMRCWFDPSGLRTLVKNRFLETLFGSNTDWKFTKPQREVLLGRLKKVAVAIDEEREFAVLNAYAAYKFGRRAWIVTTYAEFNIDPLWVEKNVDVAVMRDIDIRFPDIPYRVEWPEDCVLDREKPRDQLKTIGSALWGHYIEGKKVKKRINEKWMVRVVSSNPNIGTEFNSSKENEKRLGERKEPRKYLGLYKPIGTLYEIRWLLQKKPCHSWCIDCHEVSVVSRIQSVESEKATGNHGAPYLNLAIAESLLQQSRRYVNGPVESLLGALLASESYELLFGMSKTTALEALLAMHRAEVRAEVEFPGISHDILIEERKRDVESTLYTLYTPQVLDDDEKISDDTPNKSSCLWRQASSWLIKLGSCLRWIGEIGLVRCILKEEESSKSISGLSAEAKKVRYMFLSQFWSELRVCYRNGEQFKAAEMANLESLIHLSWRPNTNWFQKSMGWPRLGPDLKRYLLYPALSLSWLGAYALIFSFFMAICYWWKSGCAEFAETWWQVIMWTLQVQLGDEKNDIVAMTYDLWLLNLIHMFFSYLLLGLLVSVLYRKITRG